MERTELLLFFELVYNDKPARTSTQVKIGRDSPVLDLDATSNLFPNLQPLFLFFNFPFFSRGEIPMVDKVWTNRDIHTVTMVSLTHTCHCH
jgi:hypothetical protein